MYVVMEVSQGKRRTAKTGSKRYVIKDEILDET